MLEQELDEAGAAEILGDASLRASLLHCSEWDECSVLVTGSSVREENSDLTQYVLTQLEIHTQQDTKSTHN